ncbi:11063_t:CDS:2 [Paraglomus brasilianum]|uniref:11063_t:CDS:1 n=1 Tax=Paraglomus brasilianum TaxID=144538 RepID=A0A9N9CM98_9GLOM|nr:11063_t:CDS:2 [Paraglomus brasilianum]
MYIQRSEIVMPKPLFIIGEGANGKVYKAEYDGKPVAIKISKEERKSLENEFRIYSRLKHENVLKFYGVMEDETGYCLVLEYAFYGTLKSYLQTETVSWKTKAQIAHDICRGVQYCHLQTIVHYDIKAENVLLTEDLKPKIADFGISRSRTQHALDGKIGGTMSWVAPERCQLPKCSNRSHQFLPPRFQFSYKTVALDGKTPYSELTYDHLIAAKRSRDCIDSLHRELADDTPAPYAQAFVELTRYNPSERPSLEWVAYTLHQCYDKRSTNLDISHVDETDPILPTSTDPVPPTRPLHQRSRSEMVGDGSNQSTSQTLMEQHSARSSVVNEGSNDSIPPTSKVWITVGQSYFLDKFYSLFLEIEKPGFRSQALDSWFNDMKIAPYAMFELVTSANNHVHWECMVGWCHEQGIGTIKDHEKAFEWYKKSAESGDPIGQAHLGICYLTDVGPEHNEEEGKRWLTAAAQENSALGLYKLGHHNHYSKPDQRTPASEKLAFESFQRAAEMKHIPSQMELGNCYMFGVGTPPQSKKGFQCMLSAAEAGYPDAQYWVGWWCEIGKGTQKNARKAREWYTRAARNRYHFATNELRRLERRSQSWYVFLSISTYNVIGYL